MHKNQNTKFNQSNESKKEILESEPEEVTSVTAFPEKRGDDLTSGIVGFDQQNPQPLPSHHLPCPVLLVQLHALPTAQHRFTHSRTP